MRGKYNVNQLISKQEYGDTTKKVFMNERRLL
uniref:Uncharacterized protein n=1 Tax=Siphoviridae sp. ctQ0C17 TaxID=2826325 RepID=A0A8S5NDC9_9CAUD|nr:MAG TPA: hypothetical protein [Siphoviridae sp. ctQ0C17]